MAKRRTNLCAKVAGYFQIHIDQYQFLMNMLSGLFDGNQLLESIADV